MSTIAMRQRQVQLIACRIFSHNIAALGKSLSNGIDISASVQRVDLYESLFQNTISGNLVVTENIGFVELLPLVGIETLYLAFSITDDSGKSKTYARTFRITKVHDQTFIKYDNRTYVIEFVTTEFMASVSKRISRRFQMSCSEAVKTIVDDVLHDKTSDQGLYSKFAPGSPLPTWGTVDITIPNYAPLRAINYFAMLSLAEQNRESGGYLFFETLEGLYFTSLRHLIETGKARKDIPTIHVNSAMSSTADPNDDTGQRNAIFRFTQEQTFDLLGGVASGMYRSRALQFDLLATKFRGHDLKSTDTWYTKSFKQTPAAHLNPYPLFPEYYEQEFSPNIRQFMVPTNIWSTANTQTTVGKVALQAEQLMHESVVARNRQLREIRQIESLVELPGQPNIHAGSVIKVIYPPTRLTAGTDLSPQSSQPAIVESPHSGYHMVASVHHMILFKTPGEYDYRMSLRVTSDSLSRPMRTKNKPPKET
jgi:predicted metallopeptidase